MTLLEGKDIFIDYLTTKLTARGMALKVLQSHKDFLTVNAINLKIVTEGSKEGLYPNGINEMSVSLDVLVNEEVGGSDSAERKASTWSGFLIEDLKAGFILGTEDVLKLTWNVQEGINFIDVPHDEYSHKNLMLELRAY